MQWRDSDLGKTLDKKVFKFYKPKQSKEVVFLTSARIKTITDALQPKYPQWANMTPKEIESSKLCATNKDVYDCVTKWISHDTNPWTLKEIQKVGIYARYAVPLHDI